jgi:2-hydroxy-6-oxonona-2,4-dienedioate hydrolase
MMNVFVYDTSALTEELFQTRLDNMLTRRDHLENFVRSHEVNLQQFADVGHRPGEIAAPTLAPR